MIVSFINHLGFNMSLTPECGWESIEQNNVHIFKAGKFKNLQKIIDTILENPENFDAVKRLLHDENLCFGLIIRSPEFSYAISDRVQGYTIYYESKSGEIHNALPYTLSPNDKNQTSVTEFSTSGYVLGNKTLSNNYQQLQAGEIIFIKNNSPQKTTVIERYYRYMPTPDNTPKTKTEWEELLDKTLNEIFLRLIETAKNRPLCIPLSGGLDSRLILAKLHENGAKNIITFSYGLKNNFEAVTAKKMAGIIGVPWHMISSDPSSAETLFKSDKRKKYTHYSHGLSRTPSYVEYEALHKISQMPNIPKNTIIINGQTGDFLSGGHIPESLFENENPCEHDLYRYILDKHFSLWKNLKIESIEKQLIQNISEILTPYDHTLSKKDNLIRQYESFEWQERQCKMVVNGQKAYDFFGFDWMLPLWDKTLIDFFETVPWELKYEQRLFKSYLRSYNYKDMFTLPAAKPVIWKPHQYWILCTGRLLGILKSFEAKNDYYKKMFYYGDQYFQYALFGKNIYNTHYKNIRNMMSLAARNILEDLKIDFLGDN